MRIRELAVISIFFGLPVFLPAAEPQAKSAAKPGPERAAFDRIFQEWKAMLKDLQALKAEYRTADDQRRTEIEKKWKELMEKAQPMPEELIAAAAKAYAEAPNADKEVTDLLLSALGDWDRRDDYEKAFPIGKLLVDNKCPDEDVFYLAGMAAFAVNDFDAAEKYYQSARRAGKLPPASEQVLNNIAYYKTAWAKEQQLREAEAKDNLPHVLLKTSQGDIEVELFENEAPNTVANFITLVEKGFYNGLTFHRVLPGFMAQGGDPKGDGNGGPGYQIPAEFNAPKHRLHFRGSLAMARSKSPDSAGSQFFLMFVPKIDLDGNYTVFGRMVKGFDVLAKIRRIDPEKPSDIQPDKIIEAKVLSKRPHEYVVKKTGE